MVECREAHKQKHIELDFMRSGPLLSHVYKSRLLCFRSEKTKVALLLLAADSIRDRIIRNIDTTCGDTPGKQKDDRDALQ